VVGAEAVRQDWARAKGIDAAAVADELPPSPGDPRVSRPVWAAPGARSVVFSWIEGGGHGWPGGPQYLPRSTHRAGRQAPRRHDPDTRPGMKLARLSGTPAARPTERPAKRPLAASRGAPATRAR